MEANTLKQYQHTHFYTYRCPLMKWFNHQLLFKTDRIRFLLDFLLRFKVIYIYLFDVWSISYHHG